MQQFFRNTFGRDPEVVVRAPGRVNIIGEHTDYNGGFVLPCAVDRWVMAAAAATDDSRLTGVSMQFCGMAEAELHEAVPPSSWIRYPAAVAQTLMRLGLAAKGAMLAVQSSIPTASGLSSSAALETASCLIFESLGGFSLTPKERTGIAHMAETEVVGLQCGIMDMFASSEGTAGHAMLLDTASGCHEAIPLPASAAILVMDTGVRRSLTDGEYNNRSAECRDAVQRLQGIMPMLKSLRGLGEEDLPAVETSLPDVLFRRVRHVVTENRRTVAAAEALRKGEMEVVGTAMRGSHRSLRDDYDVSCAELDCLADALNALPHVFGARMTGAGFGGCVVALVERGEAAVCAEAASLVFQKQFGRYPKWMECRASGGAERIR